MAWDRTDRRSLVLQVVTCLVPLVVAAIAWDDLPDTMVIHWGLHNEPNGWAPKLVACVLLPGLPALLQVLCVLVSEWQIATNEANEDNEEATPVAGRPKVLVAAYWVMPVMSVVLSSVTIAYALGHSVNIGKVVLLLLAGVLIVPGNYLPKMSYDMAKAVDGRINHLTISRYHDEASFRRATHMTAYLLMALGLGALVGSFFV